jgi:hypothetical protein
MSSIIEICNVALSAYLGEARINSLTDTSKAATECNLHYDPTRRMLLERNWWHFATGRQTLAQLTNDREEEWLFKYARPTAALSIRWVNDPFVARMRMAAHHSPDAERETTIDALYSDTPLAVCEFTRDLTDPTLYPQSFAEALSAALAARLAMPLTQDVRRAREARDMAQEMLSVAIAEDFRNQPPQEPGLPQYLQDRGLDVPAHYDYTRRGY